MHITPDSHIYTQITPHIYTPHKHHTCDIQITHTHLTFTPHTCITCTHVHRHWSLFLLLTWTQAMSLMSSPGRVVVIVTRVWVRKTMVWEASSVTSGFREFLKDFVNIVVEMRPFPLSLLSPDLCGIQGGFLRKWLSPISGGWREECCEMSAECDMVVTCIDPQQLLFCCYWHTIKPVKISGWVGHRLPRTPLLAKNLSAADGCWEVKEVAHAPVNILHPYAHG